MFVLCTELQGCLVVVGTYGHDGVSRSGEYGNLDRVVKSMHGQGSEKHAEKETIRA